MKSTKKKDVTRYIYVLVPIFGGKPRTFETMKSCCAEIEINERTLYNYFSDEKKEKWNNKEWVISKTKVEVDGRGSKNKGKGKVANFAKKKEEPPQIQQPEYDKDGNYIDPDDR